jgi:uncharacterized membrane protein
MTINDADIELRMGRLLQRGVTLAAAVMIVGGTIYLARHGGEIPDYKNFHGVLPEFKTVTGILRGAVALQGRAIIQLGVLLMIATPVFRVVFALVAFALERDWLYTVVSGIVLALLGYSLFW